MSNSNNENSSSYGNYRNRSSDNRSNFRSKSTANKDRGGFRIKLSDNEMKAVKSIQEVFQLKSTVAVLGFSVRTLSEMIKDKDLIESISKLAKNNKNSSLSNHSINTDKKEIKKAPNPFARPTKASKIEDNQTYMEEEDVN